MLRNASDLRDTFVPKTLKILLCCASAFSISVGFAQAQAEPDEFSTPFSKTSKGQISVSADLQGRQLNMIFDTGAEECLFGRNQISAANLANAERSKTVILNSVSGPVSTYRILAEVKLGGLKKRIPICVQDTDMDSAILGQPFFKGYDCSVDNQAGLIRFRKVGGRSGITYDSIAVPFTEVGDKIIVTAKLNGRNTDMCFDTGAFGVCLSKAQCQKIGLSIPESPSTYTRGPDGRRVPSWEIRANLALGPITKYSCPMRVIDAETSYPLLGQNFFGDRMFNIDRSKKEIRFAR